MNNALEISGVTKQFSDFTLGPVQLSLPCGCIMGLIGENGAGKSTTIKLILNLLKADSGSIRVLGSPSIANDRALKERIGVVMDESNFPENLTLANIDHILQSCYRTWDSKRFRSFAGQFQLPEKKRVKDYSRGMKMKLSISVALSHASELLLLDEATSGLDPIVRDEILDVFLDFIQDERHAILISSHIISDLEKVCDYVAFLHHGRLVFNQPKDELLQRFVLAKAPADAIAAIDPGKVVGIRRSSFGAEALVERNALPHGMIADAATLEDIMLYHVKEGRSV